ncbi:MAG: hypothetical protein HGB32_01730 [Geobacteraceae bacterium]|nr:hypothetical protein [Geobacteraceae bacterium]NTW78853.1 hypothetical protein [Geobacteraceae bacterium]
MKRLLVSMLTIVMLVLSGCGDATVSILIPIGPVIEPPAITSYQFTKNTVTELIEGSVDFYAPDSDIDTMTVVVFDPRGYEIFRSKTFIYLTGAVSGTIPFRIDYYYYPSEVFAYTFSIYLTDFNGNTSNQAVDTFNVP